MGWTSSRSSLNLFSLLAMWQKFGQSGIVIQINDSAFKGPFDDTIKDIEFEGSVYENLGRHPRIAEYRGFRGKRIELKFYKKGDVNGEIFDERSTIPLIKWADQILEALIFIHDKKTVHGDLRCANILVTDELDLVLADFGSAAINGIKETDTFYDTRHCTPGFRKNTITPQDDLFAFGTVLYHLATRKLPFEGYNDEYVARSYMDGKFPDVSGLEVGHIIERCWRKSYQSAIEIQGDLRQLHSSRFGTRLSFLSPFALGCGVLFILLLAKHMKVGHRG